jgi:hypothetical protein
VADIFGEDGDVPHNSALHRDIAERKDESSASLDLARGKSLEDCALAAPRRKRR